MVTFATGIQGQLDPKFQVEGVTRSPPPVILRVCKTRINVLSCGMKIWAEFCFCFVTIHTFNRRTDSFLVAIPSACSMVKKSSLGQHRTTFSPILPLFRPHFRPVQILIIPEIFAFLRKSGSTNMLVMSDFLTGSSNMAVSHISK